MPNQDNNICSQEKLWQRIGVINWK